MRYLWLLIVLTACPDARASKLAAPDCNSSSRYPTPLGKRAGIFLNATTPRSHPKVVSRGAEIRKSPCVISAKSENRFLDFMVNLNQESTMMPIPRPVGDDSGPVCPACGMEAIPRKPHSLALRCRCSWRDIARAYHNQGKEDLAAIAATMADREKGIGNPT